MGRLDHLLPQAVPSADQPLGGLTVLLVEDSRLASEGMRLLCRRSGARLRRADSLASAERHLRAWRPDAAVVDLHLPDGSGLDLLACLARAVPRIDVLLALSGDPAQEGPALRAGADGFLAKPLHLAAFQSAWLTRLPPDRQPPARRPVSLDGPTPDPRALREDLEHAATLLARDAALDYVARFVAGVARTAGDRALARLADDAAAQGPAPLARALRDRLGPDPTL